MQFYLLLLFIVAGTAHAYSPRVNKIVAPLGTYFGAAVDFSKYNFSIAKVPAALGHEPATYVLPITIPIVGGDIYLMDKIIPQTATKGITVILSPQPVKGLAAVTDDAINRLVDFIFKYENIGATVIVRFAQEMNVSWYTWGQRPIEFKAKFQRFAQILKQRTKRATMLWSPNLDPGYPYAGGKYSFNCKSRPNDCKQLDTNGDGKVIVVFLLEFFWRKIKISFPNNFLIR
jgi:hypothetical protein